MAQLVLSGYILVPDCDLSTVQRELEQHIKFTLEEPGCLQFCVSQSSSNPNRFDVYEEFVDRSSFEKHQTRVKSSSWGRAAINARRHYQITEQ
jgi:quinol monooxygenase YgiN